MSTGSDPTSMAGDDDDGSGSGGGAEGCPAGVPGSACVLHLYDQAVAGCDPDAVAAFADEVAAHPTPLWAGGRALFRTHEPMHVAGDFNGWDPTALASAAVCGTGPVVAIGDVPSGLSTYKLVATGDVWTLDPDNHAFAYDDFAANSDGRNSVLDTPDSGRGHLVQLDDACSTSLGNCRGVTAYLPPGYDADDRTYPVLFMHDGQNVWDDHDCCFGHTGWEINITLDREIAAGTVAPIIVIAADNTVSRNNEYGLDTETMNRFIAFQVDELQPQALAQVRASSGKVAIAGSSLGGLVSMYLALEHPETYASVASLSGAFWPGQDTHTALLDALPALGKHSLAVYVDHGGNPSDDSDGAADTIAVRDEMISLGWQRSDSPSCTPGPDLICYFTEPGATHDELAWKARAWRFLRALFPG